MLMLPLLLQRKHPLFSGLLLVTVDRAHENSQKSIRAAAASENDDAAQQKAASVSARPKLSKMESIVLRKIKQCLLESAGLSEEVATGTARPQRGGTFPVVELPTKVAREIFFHAAGTLDMEAFGEPSILDAVALLRAALQIPDDAYRAWLTERCDLVQPPAKIWHALTLTLSFVPVAGSLAHHLLLLLPIDLLVHHSSILHFFRPAPAVANFAEAPSLEPVGPLPPRQSRTKQR